MVIKQKTKLKWKEHQEALNGPGSLQRILNFWRFDINRGLQKMY